MSESNSNYPVSGAGLGLRRPLADKLKDVAVGEIDFMEIAPENWIHVGGAMGKKLSSRTAALASPRVAASCCGSISSAC